MSEKLSLCRLCAKKHPQDTLVKMNSDEFTQFNLAKRIHQYFIINITENDILPKNICSHCFRKVLETYEFHQQIEKAQELLKDIMLHTKIEIKEERDDNYPEHDDAYTSLFANSLFEDTTDDEPLINRLTSRSSKIREDNIKKDHLSKEHHSIETEENIKDEPISEPEKTTLKGKSNKKRKKRTCFYRKRIHSPSERIDGELRRIILYGIEEPSYVCHVCGKCYTSQSGLSSHLRCHNGEKLFKCDKCPKQYKYITSLQEHKLCHSDLRPHICPVCGVTFRTKRTLDRHSLVHTEILNYACTFCPKRFKKKYSLTIHLRLHTGERPYSCTECNHFFANDSNFIKHLKGRHGLQNVSIVKKRQYPGDFE